MLPLQCAVCRAHSRHLLCDLCLANLPYFVEAQCPQCARPLTPTDMQNHVGSLHAEQNNNSLDGQQLCLECRTTHPAYDRTLALFRYAYPVDQLITDFKFHQNIAHGHWLGKQLAEYLHEQLHESLSLLPPADAIIAVPLHPLRLIFRGYNQSYIIAKHIAQICHAPVLRNACARQKNTAIQSTLSAEERQSNMKLAFFCPESLPLRHVYLVDDVVTSGATTAAVAQALKFAGVQEITVLCIARAVSH